MPIVIDGTNGISGVDGTAASPAIEGTDSNTGIFFPAADTIAFAEGGTEVARFDSSGNLGIGTSSPTRKLDVLGSMRIYGTSGTANADTTYANADKNWYLGIRGDTSDAFCLSDDSAIRIAVDTAAIC